MPVERVLRGCTGPSLPSGPPRTVLGVVQVDLAREHVLAGGLVAAGADEALLVAVVGHRVAAAGEHQRVGELDSLEVLGLALAVGREEHRRATHVVVPEEGRQLVGVAVGVGVPVVLAEEVGEHTRRLALGEVDALLLEPEVEGGLQLALGGELRHHRRVAVVDLTEGEEVVVLDLRRLGQDVRHELLPELDVDVLDGVDPEAVDAEVDPLLVDVAHPLDDLGPLGEQVVEPGEVAVGRGLTGEGRVTAVVVHQRVVEPGRGLRGGVVTVEEGRVRERGRRVHRREGLVDVVTVVEGGAVGLLVGRGLLRDVLVLAALVVDDVRGVVGDDVEEDLHPLGVRGVDQLLHVGVGAEVRVDLGEVGDPVAVVAGALLAGGALHRLVLEARGEPDGRRAHALDVVEPGRDALEVTPVVEPLGGGVEARAQRSTGEPAAVVGGRAVGEPVGHDEVEPLAGQRGAQRRTGEGRVGRGGVLVDDRREGHQVRGVVVAEA